MVKHVLPIGRFVLVSLVSVGLLSSGTMALPATCLAGDAPLAAGGCCSGKVSMPCCRTPCCQTPAPLPERSPADQPKQSNDRLNDGRTIASCVAFWGVKNRVSERHGYSLAVPSSGSPSLVTQHVRLQN